MGAGEGRNGDSHVRLIGPGYSYRIGDGCVWEEGKKKLAESWKCQKRVQRLERGVDKFESVICGCGCG
mgnify:CR=1 FL=1